MTMALPETVIVVGKVSAQNNNSLTVSVSLPVSKTTNSRECGMVVTGAKLRLNGAKNTRGNSAPCLLLTHAQNHRWTALQSCQMGTKAKHIR